MYVVPVVTDVEIRYDAFSMEEYVRVKSSLADGKACGEDGKKTEILKHCYLDYIILEICNTALVDQDEPRQWSMLNIIPIPKTGDLRSISKYRGISLSSVVAKVYNKMILNQIKSGIGHHLRINQNGFRSDRSTTSHILAIRRLMEGAKKKSLQTVMTFIDFMKAFDTIHRGKILNSKGIWNSGYCCDPIKNMYRDTQAKVLSPGGETRYFNIHTGVLQGDTLATYLSVIVLDFLLRRAIAGNEERLGFTFVKRQSKMVKPTVVTDCDFADDIVFFIKRSRSSSDTFK